jgi:hypothetical protein
MPVILVFAEALKAGKGMVIDPIARFRRKPGV